jgi:hypothetical protein
MCVYVFMLCVCVLVCVLQCSWNIFGHYFVRDMCRCVEFSVSPYWRGAWGPRLASSNFSSLSPSPSCFVCLCTSLYSLVAPVPQGSVVVVVLLVVVVAAAAIAFVLQGECTHRGAGRGCRRCRRCRQRHRRRRRQSQSSCRSPTGRSGCRGGGDEEQG